MPSVDTPPSIGPYLGPPRLSLLVAEKKSLNQKKCHVDKFYLGSGLLYVPMSWFKDPSKVG